MIKIIDDKFTLLKEFENFCKNDSFGTRIYSHFLCYGAKFSFVDFWIQTNDNSEITAVICKFENDVILSLCDDADFDEITGFLAFLSKSSITFDFRYSGYINNADCITTNGDILIYKSDAEFTPVYSLKTPDLKEYYNLLLSCESDDFFVPDYMNFLSDVSRRQMRGLCQIYGIYNESELVSCAMTVSYTDFSVILGAVATHPMHRKHGYAGCVVKSLAQKFSDLDNVYIYTTINKNTEFYKKLGFEVCGKWVKYTYGG